MTAIAPQRAPIVPQTASAYRARHDLVSSMVWRVWREQKRTLIVVPIALAAILIGLTMLTYFIPGSLTGSTQSAIKALMRRQLGVTGSVTNVDFAIAILFFFGPYLTAMFAATLGSNIGAAMVGGASSTGLFESLLAGPYKYSDVFWAMLTTALFAAGAQWLIMTTLIAGWTFVAVAVIGSAPGLQYFVIAFLIPLPMLTLSAVLALTLSMRYPRLARINTGGSRNLLTLFSQLPAVLLWIVAMATAAWINTTDLGLVAIGASAIATLVCAMTVTKVRNPERLLEQD